MTAKATHEMHVGVVCEVVYGWPVAQVHVYEDPDVFQVFEGPVNRADRNIGMNSLNVLRQVFGCWMIAPGHERIEDGAARRGNPPARVTQRLKHLFCTFVGDRVASCCIV